MKKSVDWSRQPEAWIGGALIAAAGWAILIFAFLFVVKVIAWVLS